VIAFKEFPKIARLSRQCVVTEKIDGTNSSIFIGEDGEFLCGSRTRWITPTDDNFGFAKWAHEHKDELLALGPGHHFGEWWGAGIQRKYGLSGRRFSLFNTSRWSDPSLYPKCCYVVPILYAGLFETDAVADCLQKLHDLGSRAAPGFMDPEGVVVFHVAANMSFKKTIKNDEEPKSKSTAR